MLISETTILGEDYGYLPHFLFGIFLGCLLGFPGLFYIFASYASKVQSLAREKFRLSLMNVGSLTEDGARQELPLLIGFFHPYCNAGGGGERVLWQAVSAIQKRHRRAHITVYTGDPPSECKSILGKVEERFGLQVSAQSLRIVPLSRRWAVEASTWSRFTLLGQSLGSVYMAMEILEKDHAPDILIDSMGYAFSYPLFRIFADTKVAAYVHYPTISNDMLSLVADRKGNFNNQRFISNSRFLSSLKLIYYRLFAYAYGLVGRCCTGVLVNSSWTRDHIRAIWRPKEPPAVLFPPCDTERFVPPAEAALMESRKKTVVSIAQFRPEKNHRLQIEAFSVFLKSRERSDLEDCRLLLIGGVRNEEDAKLVHALEDYADELGIAEQVEFHVNIHFHQLQKHLQEAMVAIHTMKNEHFGIGIVECMAAGAVVLAHNSGGPSMDIIESGKTGFLCSTAEEYADAMSRVFFEMSDNEKQNIRDAARKSITRFSCDKFEAGFLEAFRYLVRAR
ncbi:unnamed protein product [Cyprideis torosa]|uniref:GDP-Man:Man(3)GlcNAc(2)-PP-Dol alpha-1,2-mannosyltransferase n=1 Tax=Cyprideis torosa TaxID=163714 RepID=A0A7R8W546_9CRUS|nr:unnamed protein product [Cyprideis torosa]CAG0884765.1 unnamed protein product [Cyprideis torosa]